MELVDARNLELPTDAVAGLDAELKGYRFDAAVENLRPPRRVRVGLIQNRIVLPTTAPVLEQRDALLQRVADLIGAAHRCGVNIVCMQVGHNDYRYYIVDT